jgi:membrane protease subunit HflC
MTRNNLLAPALGAVALVVVLANTLFVVEQREAGHRPALRRARAGDQRPRLDQRPGLNFKAPFLENVIKLDRRNLSLEAEKEEIIAADQNRLVVDAFVRYRISDPLQYLSYPA